ncbi:MAG TPA: glycoside hydrolase family 88 protein [Puia sp.]|uniref:glycoside hydrolase family 88/105 protein n=1 Tax=Puia sp. TaxID=2045100 RepID=UPI002CEE144D|nr:glycoside hydrolase family 88 protein [Puia sp.]HVU94735.1 glycoside hydrolase family 88 protein [Puia sp.]
MHKLLLIATLLLTVAGVNAQSAANAQSDSDPATLVRRVADHILQTTTYRFVNSKTKESYPTTKGLTSSPDIKAESKYTKWQYVNGVLAVGMMQTAAVLKDTKYSDYARKNYDFIFSNLDYFKKQYESGTKTVEWRPEINIGSLDDCGSMAAGLLDVYALDKKQEYMDYLQRVGDYIKNKQVRFPDGTLARNNPRKMTLWADDLYMSVPYLARMGKTTGDKSYFDFAVQQVEAFNHYIYDSLTGLYFHVFYNDENTNGVARWGRCNGWVALAQTALLDGLPDNDPRRPHLQKMLLRQILGFSRYQDSTGMWHQLLDKPDSYRESSVTAMFIYTVAHAVNKGWINPRYLSIALNGWDGLSHYVTSDGQLTDICIGTNVEENIRFYYARPRETNDTHGLGAFLLAGTELVLAKEKTH